ncbi:MULTISPECIES: amidohydrolase family protein [Amycolatopsis]|uniref:amidohydrolase family protein n=1 Tax=Amycolatopsis TaxID=1813 RepID=UPI0033A3E233
MTSSEATTLAGGVLGVAEGAVDVHSHFLPLVYRQALTGLGSDLPDNIPSLPTWSAAAQIAGMDTLGIATAILSISSPGVLLPEREATVALARSVNDAGAEIVRGRPDRFGHLASLPLPHVEDSVRELERAFDELGADGITMLTNYAGRYIGDPMFRPVLEELDRRAAVVLVHPTAPPNHEAVSFGRMIPMLEFPFETTRAFTDLVLGGSTRRFPRIRWIVSHAGAALPVLAERVAWVSRLLSSDVAGADVHAEFAKLHYDLAGTVLPTQLPALLSWVGGDRVLYGSDMTFTPVEALIPLAEQLSTTEHLSGRYRDVLRGHAELLFPRVAAR